MHTTNLSHLNLASKGFQHVTLGGRKQSKAEINKKMNQEGGIMKMSHKEARRKQRKTIIIIIKKNKKKYNNNNNRKHFK